MARKIDCPECDGQGSYPVPLTWSSAPRYSRLREDCWLCKGAGEIEAEAGDDHEPM
jgi:rRNA maturation protein Nop10